VTKKWGKKRTKKIVLIHTNSAAKIGIKIVGQSAKKRFLYSHEYRDQKIREKIRAKQLFQNHTNSASKKCWEKLIGKSTKKRFLYSHEYRDQKKGGKNARYNFSRNTRIVRTKNVGKKIVGKKGEKTFFIFTQIS